MSVGIVNIKMKLIIRNDDVSYFTKPEDLERWFGKIWNKVPIHLTVIPFVYGNGDTVPIDKRREKHFFISNNKRLVTYLKKKIKEKKVVIWQHGVTHKNRGEKFECEAPPYNFFIGKGILESTFGVKVKVFVAPHDRFSRKAIKYVEECKMDICRGFSPLPREFMFRSKYILMFILFLILYLIHGTKYRSSWWEDYGKHRELYSYRINHINYDNIDKIIEKASHGPKNPILCVAVHHRTMDQISLEKLKYLVDKVYLR